MTTTGILGVAEDELQDSYGGRAERIEHRWRFRFATPPPVGQPLAGRAAIGREASRRSPGRRGRAARSRSRSSRARSIRTTRPSAPRSIRAAASGNPAAGLPEHRSVDGGVLDDAPLDIVLDDIAHRPATDLAARRAVVFVVPYPGVTGDAGTAKFDLRSVADTTPTCPARCPISTT